MVMEQKVSMKNIFMHSNIFEIKKMKSKLDTKSTD